MRMILCLASLPLLGAAPPAPSPTDIVPPATAFRMPVVDPQQGSAACPETPMSLARRQGERLSPRDLVDLPQAQVFAAVDRRVDGCAAPMLMSEARR